MRVITEEILKDKYEEIKHAYLNCDQSHIYAESRVIATIEELMYELKELDQLTVTKLRPMSEARKIEGAVLAKVKNQDHLHKAIYADSVNKWFLPAFSDFMSEKDFEGWIPMPQYKPSQP